MKTIILILTLFPLVQSANKTVPSFSLPDLENNVQEYENIKGSKLTVIDFWATWCKPCVHAIPKLNELYQDFDNQSVQFIGINVDGPRNLSKVKPFVNALNVEYPMLLDTDQDIMQQLNVSALPTLLIADENDKIVYIHEGYQPGDERIIKEEIEMLLHGEN
jgi:thiol-disulfide isomerase/thioredoxin